MQKDLDTLLGLFAQWGKDTIDRSELATLLAYLDSALFTQDNISRLLDSFDPEHKPRISSGAFFKWIFSDAQAVQLRPKSNLGSRHLVLNFDVNKTLVMIDSVSSKSMLDIGNHVIAASCWGLVEELAEATTDGVARRWRCTVREVSIERPLPELVSYVEFIEEQFPGKELKKLKESYLHKFTQPGEPGEAMRPHCDSFLKALRLPDGVSGTEAAKRAGLQGEAVFIIPAFFELLLHLKRLNVSFCVVFRTFGRDLDDVATEFNAFCEGRHPMFPGVIFDGRDGGADYRISFNNPMAFGTFFRSSISGEEDALVYGTLEQPSLVDGLEFYTDAARFPSVKIVRGGLHRIYHSMRRRTSKPGTLAFRDYFPWWRQQDFGKDATRHNGGKLMLLGPHSIGSTQSIFFDDNIAHVAPRIVDARMLIMPLKMMSVEYLEACHIVKAEPLEAVVDHQYFIRHVERLAAAYDRRIAVGHRMKSLLLSALKAGGFSPSAISRMSLKKQKFDPWVARRKDVRTHTMTHSFPEEFCEEYGSPKLRHPSDTWG